MNVETYPRLVTFSACGTGRINLMQTGPRRFHLGGAQFECSESQARDRFELAVEAAATYEPEQREMLFGGRLILVK